MTALNILAGTAPADFAINVGKIAQFLGVPFSFVDPDSSVASPNASKDTETIVIAHRSALKARMASGQPLLSFLQPVKAILVCGWDDSPDSNDFLRQLTAGAFVRAKASGKSSHRISVAADSADFSLQWAGMEFEIASGSGGVTFESSGTAQNVQIFISRDGEPFFARLPGGGAQLLLLGSGEVADLDASASGESSALQRFEQFVPLMMFIRGYFRDRCWQAPAARACFIIDDPLLRRRYGCLDYQQLLESMERRRYSACIAFIPWNYRRTRQRNAAFFKAHSDRYGICVHGCDHTSREFGGSNQTWLRALTATALRRMERHEALSGLPFAPVMVFPQGLFSTQAMEALADSEFLAAVNTSPYPVDAERDCLSLRELLEPAIVKFSNFPLFTRRYPTNLTEFVLDLFVGKPLLLVEHHAYFGDQCASAGDFVARLNAVAPSLEWTDLNSVCSRASLVRLDSQRRSHIRFYTDRFSLSAGPAGLPSAVLYRRAVPEDESTSATINGKPAKVLFGAEDLEIPVSLEPFAQADIVLRRKRPGVQTGDLRRGFLDSTKVMLRRHASEFRDNVLDRNPWASNAAKRSIKWLRSSK